jgi:hypothetical protein
VGADGHASGRGGPDGAIDRRRVASVEPAGDVGAGDGVEDRLVVAEAPDAEALAQVGVEVDRRGERV